jgi:hypothetical protein
MRVRAILLVLSTVVLGLGAQEALWRFDHPLEGAQKHSPSASRSLEVRAMPEGSQMPYGVGVFVQSRWAVLRSVQSELAFAGYCGSIKAEWPAEQYISLHCELREGQPYAVPSVSGGTEVRVVVQRRASANKSVDSDTHRQGAAKRAGDHAVGGAQPVRAGHLQR